MNFWADFRDGMLTSDAATWLVWLVVGHFVGDWLLQPHPMALKKTSDARVRFWHCWIWTLSVTAYPFLVLVLTRDHYLAAESVGEPVMAAYEPAIAFAWLWLTHFWIDSYKPLLWYRRTVSRDPDALNEHTFRAQFNTPRGFMVNVTFDQVFHLLTLIPVAFWLAWRLWW